MSRVPSKASGDRLVVASDDLDRWQRMGLCVPALILSSYFLVLFVEFFVKPSLTGIVLDELADSPGKTRRSFLSLQEVRASFDATTDLPNELLGEPESIASKTAR
jgi:hypothetical protein